MRVWLADGTGGQLVGRYRGETGHLVQQWAFPSVFGFGPEISSSYVNKTIFHGVDLFLISNFKLPIKQMHKLPAKQMY